jgi:hypothetical protein
MNKQRRAELDKVLKILNSIDLGDAVNILETESEGEREGFENMSEGLQQTETGQKKDAAASALEVAHTDLDTLQDTIEEIISKIEEAME